MKNKGLKDILHCNNPNNQVRQKVTSNASTFNTKTRASEDIPVMNFLKRRYFLYSWYNSRVFARTADACEMKPRHSFLIPTVHASLLRTESVVHLWE